MFGFDKKLGSCVVVQSNNQFKEDDSSDLFKYDIEKRCIDFIRNIETESVNIINEHFKYIELLANKLLTSNRLYIYDIKNILGDEMKKKGNILLQN